ncbi:hypothetical protein Bbelb_386280 [Branchiostoma belcheri]|nr:hypothetical protein Bbelb_386280 [Branchiostoma belcheri]
MARVCADRLEPKNRKDRRHPVANLAARPSATSDNVNKHPHKRPRTQRSRGFVQTPGQESQGANQGRRGVCTWLSLAERLSLTREFFLEIADLSDGHNSPYVLLRAVYVQKRGQTYGILYKDDLTGDCQLVSKMPRKAQKKTTRQDPKKRASEDTRAASDDEVNRRCTHLQCASMACTRQRGNRTEIVRCKHVQLTYHLRNVRCTQPLTARRVVQTTRPHREEQQARVAVKPSTVFPVSTCRTCSFTSSSQGGRLESSFPKALHDLAYLLRVAEACARYGFQQVASPSTSEAGRNPRRVGQQRDQPGQGRVQQILPAEGQVQSQAPSRSHTIPEQQPAGRAGPTTKASQRRSTAKKFSSSVGAWTASSGRLPAQAPARFAASSHR